MLLKQTERASPPWNITSVGMVSARHGKNTHRLIPPKHKSPYYQLRLSLSPAFEMAIAHSCMSLSCVECNIAWFHFVILYCRSCCSKLAERIERNTHLPHDGRGDNEATERQGDEFENTHCAYVVVN